jgi:formate hydrogenlyase subunit 6/NADH:ubiquinone oxidoreductase subunit I
MSAATVIAPVRSSAGEVDYSEITDAHQIAWDYTISLTSLKRFFLPQVEPLFEFSCQQGKHTLQPILDKKPRVFIGVRPCDVSGLNFLDTVAKRDHDDQYYQSRRQNSFIIALACNKAAAETCFCVCGDGGPFLKEGYDIQLVSLGDYYLVEVGSAKGEALVKEHADLFTPADAKDAKQKEKLMKQAEISFGEDKAYVAAATRKISFGKTEDALWEKLGDFCLGCGGCAYICPTCTCFTVCDHMKGEGGVRERHWDACNYACYTREVSGHNPRKEQGQRLKNRFFHKLSYQFVLRNGRHACVGCGRCAFVCPGETPMPEVTASIRRGAWE